jgi:hypothetical protein
LETDLGNGCIQRTALAENALGKRMADAVGVGVNRLLAELVRAQEDLLVRKRIVAPGEGKAVGKDGVGREVELGGAPEHVLEAVERGGAFEARTLGNESAVCSACKVTFSVTSSRASQVRVWGALAGCQAKYL